MNNSDRLKRRFIELYSLVSVQRSLRLVLRAFWLGAAGTLLGWGVNALWGWLPEPLSWFGLGLLFALVPFIAILVSLYPVIYSLPPHSRWVWGVDHLLGLREQLSTAWTVIEKKQSGLVSDLLLQDMLAIMPQVRKRVMQGGWFRKLDLIASLVMVLLACLLLTSFLLQPVPGITVDTPDQSIPVTNQTPQPEGEGQGAGQTPQEGAQGGQGQQGQAQDGSQEGQGSGGEQQSGDGQGQAEGPGAGETENPGSQEAVAEALRELGSQLSQQAGTYELGEALENLDMNRSAEALDALSEQLDDLSQESRENLGQSMEDAANSLEQAGEPSLSQSMGNASESLNEQGAEGNQAAGEALGEVAGDLRDLSDSMQSAGSGSEAGGQGNSAATGNPEPINRLSDQGGEFDLPTGDSSDSGLLSPAPQDSAGENSVGGSLDAAGSSSDDVIQNPLIPNSLLWKWRDVISQYFQR